MFSAILISSNVGRGLVIRAAVNETNLLTILKSPDGYPDTYDLVRLIFTFNHAQGLIETTRGDCCRERRWVDDLPIGCV